MARTVAQSTREAKREREAKDRERFDRWLEEQEILRGRPQSVAVELERVEAMSSVAVPSMAQASEEAKAKAERAREAKARQRFDRWFKEHETLLGRLQIVTAEMVRIEALPSVPMPGGAQAIEEAKTKARELSDWTRILIQGGERLDEEIARHGKQRPPVPKSEPTLAREEYTRKQLEQFDRLRGRDPAEQLKRTSEFGEVMRAFVRQTEEVAISEYKRMLLENKNGAREHKEQAQRFLRLVARLPERGRLIAPEPQTAREIEKGRMNELIEAFNFFSRDILAKARLDRLSSEEKRGLPPLPRVCLECGEFFQNGKAGKLRHRECAHRRDAAKSIAGKRESKKNQVEDRLKKVGKLLLEHLETCSPRARESVKDICSVCRHYFKRLRDGLTLRDQCQVVNKMLESHFVWSHDGAFVADIKCKACRRLQLEKTAVEREIERGSDTLERNGQVRTSPAEPSELTDEHQIQLENDILRKYRGQIGRGIIDGEPLERLAKAFGVSLPTLEAFEHALLQLPPDERIARFM